jgi:hypothetical protein
MTKALNDVAAERRRQIEDEGYVTAHDDGHTGGEMALAAACYATPVKLYRQDDYAAGVFFQDPWPWEGQYDKRPEYEDGNTIPDPVNYSREKRRSLLVRAGALIIAEIERLDRLATPTPPEHGKDKG